MDKLTVYARREPTTDSVLLESAPQWAKTKKDVQVYKDQECTIPFARFMWFQDGPDKRYRHVVLNCYEWKLEWVEDLP